MTSGRVAYVERERRELVLLNYVEPTRSPLSMMSGTPAVPAADGDSEGDALGYVSYFAELIDEWACRKPIRATKRCFVSNVDGRSPRRGRPC